MALRNLNLNKYRTKYEQMFASLPYSTPTPKKMTPVKVFSGEWLSKKRVVI